MKSNGALLVNEDYDDGFAAYDQKNYSEYFYSGLSFPKQSAVFNVAPLPEDAIPTREGKAIIPANFGILWVLLGYLNSSLVRYFVNETTGLHKQSGSIGMIPVPPLESINWYEVGEIARKISLSKFKEITFDESSRVFSLPFHIKQGLKEIYNPYISVKEGYQKIDSLVALELELSNSTQEIINSNSPVCNSLFNPTISDLLSYSIGAIFGRWDIRLATGQREIPELPDPFAPLPDCSPGMLTGEDGLPLLVPPPGYPIQVDQDGLLVDDPDHSDDIVRRVRDVLEVIWSGKAEAIEREACDILGVKELRDYFRQSGKGGFWQDHISRYSKSRRKAPIYWLLQSSKRSFGLWLYYHRLDKDLLYKALVNYVEPKLRLEEGRLEGLVAQKEASPGKAIERQIEKQEGLLSELRDFEEKLRRAANLNLEPDLNDGVVLNIAPLWEVVPWPEAKKYWEELKQGKYEWSSIGKQLRERKIVR